VIKDRRFSFVFAFCAVLPILLGACLNPVEFSPDSIPRIPVDVSGQIDVNIKDVAVFWIVNRTKNVDVTSLNIERAKGKNEAEEDYAYPMTYTNRPMAGQSLATYHSPTDLFYTISVEYAHGGNTASLAPFEVQFPKAVDYVYHLYWDKNGELRFVEESRVGELGPNNTDDWSVPSSDSVSTMVVLNVTKDQNIDLVEFTQDASIYVITNEPRAKDQQKAYLAAGSYETKAFYTRGGVQRQTTVKNAIVTKEQGSMAVRTNFLYFYKTTAGDYQLSQNWPPIPNDASGENSPEDALDDSQGFLKITSNAVPNNPHALVARININGTEYPDSSNTSNYMGPGESRTYILAVGPVDVLFKPVDQTYYGQVSRRDIESRKTTELFYVNDMGNPFAFPESTGYGSGLIWIKNNSTAVVVSAAVYKTGVPGESITIGYDDFTPPYPINYRGAGFVPVVGTSAVSLESGETQLIQVVLETVEGLVVVEQTGALYNNIVEVEITDAKLKPAGRTGSKVTVTNNTTTPTNILGMYVYGKDNSADANAVYALDIPKQNSQTLYVLSTTGLPIISGKDYGARLTVYGNGNIAVINKDFSPNGKLYSTEPDKNLRTITLEEADVPAAWKTPVSDIESSIPAELASWYNTDWLGGNPQLTVPGSIILDHNVVVKPDNAAKKSPINWSIIEGSGYVSLDTASRLTVTGIPPNPASGLTVKVRAAIAEGKITADYTKDFTLTLKYQNMGVRTQQVSGISLSSGTVQQSNTLDLRSLAVLSPEGANINGVPISKDDLVWYFEDGSTTHSNGTTISGFTLTAGSNTGSVYVYAVLPAAKNGGALRKSLTADVTITSAPITFVPVSSITPVGGSISLPYYTKTVGSNGKTFVSASQLNLNGAVTVAPPTATVQTITWTSSPPTNVSLSNGVLSVNGLPGSQTVTVTATIAGATNNGAGTYSTNLTVNLVEHHSRLVGPNELAVANRTINVGDTLDLNTLAALPAGAKVDTAGGQWAITVEDLSWTFTNGSGTAGLSGKILTGTTAGQVTVTATLPAAKNDGNAVSKSATITVKATHPDYLTLRIIKLNATDDVSQIVLVETGAGASYGPQIKATGHTNVRWVNSGTTKGAETKVDGFTATHYGDSAKYYSISKLDKDGDYADITIPWSVRGYNLFFIEGDGRVRGYVNPGALDPNWDKNFLFFLHPETLYGSYRLWMKGDKQAVAGTAGAVQVVPIGYNSYYNTASIMKAEGTGKRPKHDIP
jgi:hypothetical protein